jgi:hypothetical protein
MPYKEEDLAVMDVRIGRYINGELNDGEAIQLYTDAAALIDEMERLVLITVTKKSALMSAIVGAEKARRELEAKRRNEAQR